MRSYPEYDRLNEERKRRGDWMVQVGQVLIVGSLIGMFLAVFNVLFASRGLPLLAILIPLLIIGINLHDKGRSLQKPLDFLQWHYDQHIKAMRARKANKS